MKFSTSSILCLVSVAAAATTVSSSTEVSVRKNRDKWSFGEKVLHKKRSSKSDESVPSPSSSKESLTLYGLDRSVLLTKNEALFLEEVIKDTYNEVYEETGKDLYTNSVSIEDVVVVDDNDNTMDEEGNRALLRGSNNNNKGEGSSSRRKLGFDEYSDLEMCSRPDGSVIEGCEFDICFYMDCYCHDCFDDDVNYYSYDDYSWNPPTSPPNSSMDEVVLNKLNESPFSNDDDDVWPTSPSDLYDDDYFPWGTTSPSNPPTSPPNCSMDEVILNKLRESPFQRFRGITKVRFGVEQGGYGY